MQVFQNINYFSSLVRGYLRSIRREQMDYVLESLARHYQISRPELCSSVQKFNVFATNVKSENLFLFIFKEGKFIHRCPKTY